MPGRHLALVGMMAVGKSTVGRAVAARLGVPFVDTDDVIEAHTGLTLRELWDEGGEAAYRPLEREAVRCALAETRPVVLAVPGGVAVDHEMAAHVTAPHVTTVLLRAELDTLARHVGPRPRRRPLLGADPRAMLAQLLDERRDRYEAIADHVIDVDGLRPAGVVGQVLAVVGGDVVGAARSAGRA